MARVNPYNCTTPGNLFVGRERLRRKILNGLRDGNSFALLGGRRCGKTSLLLQLGTDVTSAGTNEGVDLHGLTVLPRYMDMQAFNALDPGHLFGRLYELATQGLDVEAWSLPTAGREYLGNEGFLKQMMQATPALEARYGNRWLVVFLIDELDAAITRLPDDQFFQNLRNLLMVSELHHHFRVVATGVRGMGTLISSGSSPLKDLRHCSLSVLVPRNIEVLLSSGFEDYVAAAAPDADLMGITGGHPYLLQVLLEFAWVETAGQWAAVDPPLFRAAQRQFLREHSDFHHWLDAFDDAEHAVYRALASAPNNRLNLDQLYESLDPSLYPDVDDAIAVLSYHGVVDDSDPDEPRAVAKMFSDWYQRSVPIKVGAKGDDRGASENGKTSSLTKVFISYSHKDTVWLQKLKRHLKHLERENAVEHWDDTRIAPGADWRAEIDQSLNDAAVAILLVSADFLDSDFVVDEELPLLLEAVNDRGLVVIPVLIGPVYLPESSPLARLQTANDGNVPLMNMNEGDQEALFVRVVEAVESALKP